jgi:biotin-(acetyl-CoA carboxylase) ligase
VTSSGETLTGLAVDIDSDGSLILRMEDGRQKRIVTGDVEYDQA